MPLTYTCTFRVRSYECDTYGHVNNAHYLRYMQEAALDASSAVGYAPADYTALGHFWLIRETDIDYLAPLRYGDEVAVTTWVVDFQRVRSRRAYELKRVADQTVVARSLTEWVYVDGATRRPAAPPPEMSTAFQPDPSTHGPRTHFPDPPPPPAAAFSTTRRVRWRDIDSAGHVNNAVYLEYLEDVGMQASAARGWPMTRVSTAGFGIFARRHRIEYRQSAQLDDELRLTTWLSHTRAASATRHTMIQRAQDDTLLARAFTVLVFVDLATGRPTRIGDTVWQDFAPTIAPMPVD